MDSINQVAQGISLSDIINHLSGALMITDCKGTVTFVNPQFTELFGYEAHDVIGQNPSIFQSSKHDHYFYSDFWNILIKDGKWEGEVWNKKKTGEITPYWLSISAQYNQHGVVQNYIALYQDLSYRKVVEDDMQTLAFTDSLTNLPNRRYFKKHFEMAIEDARKSKSILGILFLDLNRFKYINDTLGHHVGDILLKEVARRLKLAVRTTDLVARMGGDEFVVLLPYMQNPENASIVCNKISEQMDEPFWLEGKDYHITLSIGISIYPYDGTLSGELMQKSDIAMYRAKQEGNHFQYYFEDMSLEGREKLEIENDLRRALEQNEFELHYQPQIDIETKEVMGVEALLRWKHSTKGYISPAVFIPIAEELGLIPQIGKWVLHTACRQNKEWQLKGYKPIIMAVNLSPKQFKKRNVLETVSTALSTSKLDPKYLELELTESGIAEKPEYVIQTLTDLKKMGVRIAIDDFGTGYSSLSHLRRFPIDFLKIDRSFIGNIQNGNEPISTAIIAMAKNLQMGVIAEGVETEEQSDFLQEHGCFYMQGFLFSKPILAKEVEKLLIKL